MLNIKGLRILALAAAVAAGTASVAYAADPMVGGAPMMATKTIVENASQASTLTTLVAAVKQAGLVETLSGPGPFTVFAPTNAAFAKLPPATVEALMKPEMKADLTKILTYHVVPGRISTAELMKMIKMGHGQATLKTVAGESLIAKMAGHGITLTDEKGNVAHITIANVYQSNGVIQVIDTVMLPS